MPPRCWERLFWKIAEWLTAIANGAPEQAYRGFENPFPLLQLKISALRDSVVLTIIVQIPIVILVVEDSQALGNVLRGPTCGDLVSESVWRVQAGLQSFLSMTRIDARRKNARCRPDGRAALDSQMIHMIEDLFVPTQSEFWGAALTYRYRRRPRREHQEPKAS